MSNKDRLGKLTICRSCGRLQVNHPLKIFLHFLNVKLQRWMRDLLLAKKCLLKLNVSIN